jgi:hypothetical protein
MTLRTPRRQPVPRPRIRREQRPVLRHPAVPAKLLHHRITAPSPKPLRGSRCPERLGLSMRFPLVFSSFFRENLGEGVSAHQIKKPPPQSRVARAATGPPRLRDSSRRSSRRRSRRNAQGTPQREACSQEVRLSLASRSRRLGLTAGRLPIPWREGVGATLRLHRL